METLRQLCHTANTKISQLLKSATDNGPTGIYLVDARSALDEVESIARHAEQLSEVLAELKPLAWPAKSSKKEVICPH
ncbi:hypothetical protein ACUHMQ_19850 [Chitinimonas sp. PSY-7]|uniref:hypothetical protein n=1 Tax=Chitinimonas sp. PSY-7 TaxID=3459088 RepID=UPI00404025E3